MPTLRLVTALFLLAPNLFAAEKVDFGRDILPILSDNCFHCHGPDADARKAKLRLDVEKDAFRTRGGITTIVAGDAAGSEVYRRLVSHDAGELMPPPDSNRKLTPPQIDLVKRWIDEGAKWGKHWSFEPLPKTVPVPDVQNAAWPKNAIDSFIAARLEREKIAFAAETSREVWLRRVTLDLTGLPAAPAEQHAFAGDASPHAYAVVIDRLLAGPRHAERMAVDWLDVARFADTHGYQSDRFRAMWPYRDWVIAAFRRNQRFDEFLTWQLAGDLLPNSTQEMQLATAFNRLHMQNEEGGVVAEEFRVAYVADRVNTMGTAFLGLTFECSRCHDHKFDPIKQKDYYSLFAMFQNIDEYGQTSYFTDAMPVPALPLATPPQRQRLDELAREIVAKERQLREAHDPARFTAWTKAHPNTDMPLPQPIAEFAFDDAKTSGTLHDAAAFAAGKVGKAIELNGDNGAELPNVGHFRRVDPFTIALWLRPTQKMPRGVILHRSRAAADAGSRGYEILLEDGKLAFGMHHMWPGNSLKIVAQPTLPLDEWTHVAVSYDGSSRASGATFYVNGKPAEATVIRDGLTKDITYPSEPQLGIGYRFRDSGFKGGAIDELKIYNSGLVSDEVTSVASGRSTVAVSEEIYFARVDSESKRLRDELHGLRVAANQLVTPIADVMVMREMAEPKPAFILKRGDYTTPGEAVAADTPGFLPALPKESPRNRLGLAKWLTDPDHPLTARVTVNRLWQMMFGRGIVETSDNFGSTGAVPTHPELLDWLARDFVAHGWDVRHTLKRIALSATYRQSSRATAEQSEKDPLNALLSHYPAHRLSAEMLRDQALFAAGLLVEKVGGPSVYPYQPEGLWNEAMGRPHYPQSTGDNLYRRSLYTVWKRTAPHPQMTIFDAADRSVCSVRRQATGTPLQALGSAQRPAIRRGGALPRRTP